MIQMLYRCYTRLADNIKLITGTSFQFFERHALTTRQAKKKFQHTNIYVLHCLNFLESIKLL